MATLESLTAHRFERLVLTGAAGNPGRELRPRLKRRTSVLAAFAVDARTGALAPIGRVPTETQPRGFAIDASGRWLLAGGEQSHRMSVYAIDIVTGELRKHGEHAVGRSPNWIENVALGDR